MKTTLSTSQAVDTFMKFKVFGTGPDSYSLCYTMVEWLEQYEEDTGEELEIDPIAIRCEYRVVDLRDVCEEYTIDATKPPFEYLQDNTVVIATEFEDIYIIQEF